MRLTTRKKTPTSPNRESASVLRWIFQHGTRALTCEVRVQGGQSFDVCVVPHWNISSSVVEGFDRPASALRRHAEIARSLRNAGWVLACRAGSERSGRAA
jgi:hypothetical protein